MAKVLIIGDPLDIHVDAVAWALNQRGHEAVTWNFSAFPGRQYALSRITPDGRVSLAFRETNRRTSLGEFDVVWRRRDTMGSPSAELPEGDRQVATRESVAFRDAGLTLLAPGARWVNPDRAAVLSRMKPLQLREAAKAGLRIPDTLCSNDPEEVCRFAKLHHGRIVYKPFSPAIWLADEAQYVTETSLLDAADLDNDFAIAAAPGIYQPCIDKAYELRITVLGADYIAAKLELPGSPNLPVDIKPVVDTQVTATEVALPDDIWRGCRRMMDALGIVFGCIDLAVTAENEFLFLEVNQAGQFLWVEDLNPDIPVLNVFAYFIASGMPDFRRPKNRDDVSMRRYLASERNQSLHAAAAASFDPDRKNPYAVAEPA